jgi:hypothetical protein
MAGYRNGSALACAGVVMEQELSMGSPLSMEPIKKFEIADRTSINPQ